MRVGALAAVVALAIMAAFPVRAQTYEQLEKWCYGDSTDDQTLQGCDAVIEAKKVTIEDLATAHANLAYAYEDKDEYKLAIKECDEALGLNANSSIALVNRGLAYEHLGKHDRAIADYDKALAIKPDDAIALTDRGMVYARLGQYDRAIEDYDQALRINVDYARAFYNRGIAKHKIGDTNGGDADIGTAKQLDPNVGE